MKAPWRTGKPAEEVTLTGAVFPWTADEQPYLVSVIGDESGHYLPCFSTADKLRAFMQKEGFVYAKIKQIEEGREFMSSIPTSIHVILDPWHTPEGRVRFTMILRDA